jgi:hypothetical protein
MGKILCVAAVVASAWLCCGDAMAQTGGTQPSPAQAPGTKIAQTGNQNSDWFVAALNGLSACYRSALEKLQEADNNVMGAYDKDILKCNQTPASARACVETAKKKMNEARLPIDQKRVDVSTTYRNLQSRIQTARANGGTCSSTACCTNSQGTSAPATGPDGRTCSMEAQPQGWGNCDANFQNILNP